MLLLIDNPEPNIEKRVLDTETGIYYDLTVGWPAGMARPEAEEEGKLFEVVTVRSVHGSAEGTPGVRYERAAGLKLWKTIAERATHCA